MRLSHEEDIPPSYRPYKGDPPSGLNTPNTLHGKDATLDPLRHIKRTFIKVFTPFKPLTHSR